MATDRKTLAFTMVGALLLSLAAVAAVLLFLQPWVSCTVDDVSAGCPVPEDLRSITVAGWVVTVLAAAIGTYLLVMGRLLRDR